MALFGIYTRALFPFLKKNGNENPHVHVESPIYLCGSLAGPLLLLLLTPLPQQSRRHLVCGNCSSLRSPDEQEEMR